MTEKKSTFTSKYDPIMDDVIGKMFTPGAVRSCPEPHVVKRYGVGGVANVSVWTCRKCRYVKTYKWHGGVSCEYKE